MKNGLVEVYDITRLVDEIITEKYVTNNFDRRWKNIKLQENGICLQFNKVLPSIQDN